MQVNLCRVLRRVVRSVLAAAVLFTPLGWGTTANVALGQADEAAFKYARTHYAAPAAVGDGSGKAPDGAMSLERAIEAVGETDTRIVLLDGDYRKQYTIGAGKNVLVLEAQNTGKASITGSDPVTDYKPGTDGVYTFPWTANWGINHDQFIFPGQRTRFNQRRELLFVDGQRLTQRVDEANKGVAVDPPTLKPGEFTVDDAGGRVHFKPAEGVTLGENSVVEMGVRGYAPGTCPNDGSAPMSLSATCDRTYPTPSGATCPPTGTSALPAARRTLRGELRAMGPLPKVMDAS